MKRARVLLAVIVVAAIAIRLSFFFGDEQPHQLAGLSATQGEIARNIVKHGKWFVVNRRVLSLGRPPHAPKLPAPGHKPVVGPDNSVNDLQEHLHRLVDPSELDYSVADRTPDYQPYVIHMQGTAVLLAGLWKLTGDMDYGYLQVIQELLGGLMTLLVWWIAMRLYARPRAALVAAALYALALPLGGLLRIPFYDAWAALLVPPVFALFLKAREAGTRWAELRWLVATGVLLGVSLYFRPPIALLVFLLGLAVIPARGWRAALGFALVPLTVALVMLAPWTIRNAVEFHRFLPANTGTGQVLWQGLGEIHNDFGAYNDDNRTRMQVQSVRPDLQYDTPAYDDFLRHRAVRAIRRHPGHYADLIVHRLLRGTVQAHNLSWTNHAFRSNPQPAHSLRDYVTTVWDKLQLAVFYVGDPALVIVALLTAFATRRRYRDEHLLLLAVPAALLLVPLFLALEWRYVAPAAFAYMILVGLAVDAGIDWFEGRRRAS